jgi:asparagine N-glycosylation enzyme membrane subunit Stt3
MPEEDIKLDLKSTKDSFNKLIKWIKKDKVAKIIIFSLLLIIVIAGVLMRLQNLPLMVDQATGQYMPQLELDAFYWLREATLILNTGGLPAVDPLRVIPGQSVGFFAEIMPWVIVDMYKFVHIFNSSITLNFIDVISPVIFFGIDVVLFYFLVNLLTKSKIAAIISSAFLIVIPTYLYRTVSGFADHNALGMAVLFLVLIFYTYSLIWLNKKNSENKTKKTLFISFIFGAIFGFLIALNIVSWGGISELIPFIVPISFFVFWILKIKDHDSGKSELSKLLIFYVTFIISSIISIYIFNLSTGSAISRILTGSTSILMSFVLVFIIIDFFLVRYGHKIPIKNLKKHHLLYSIIIAFIIGCIILAFRGGLISLLSDLSSRISNPFGATRLTQTVAEDKATFTTDWISQTDTIFFWLFFSGAVIFGIDLSQGVKGKKRKIGFIALWTLLIGGLLLSRFSQSSPIFNGTSFFSYLFLFGSIILFIFYSIRLYFKDNLELTPEQIILFAITITILAIANSIYYVMVLVSPFACLYVGYLILSLGLHFKKSKDDLLKMILGILLIGAIIAATLSFINLYNNSSYQAKNTGIGSYGAQWDYAMAWVQKNTLPGSIFVHWWDYGYAVQLLGDRPTLADGGHFEGTFRDYMIGRYILTEPNPNLALSFMKSNNVSYLLIDSTDLGKYPAYSFIGSDSSGTDRYSSVPIMTSNPSQTQIVNNSVTRVYQNVVPTDQDIFYNTSQGQIFIPQGQAYVVGIILQSNQSNSTGAISFSQPQEVIYYNSQQIQIPIRYLYFNNKLVDFGQGFAAGIEILPTISQSSTGSTQIDNFGSVIYMSPKVFNGLFAQLYLMNDPFNEYPTVKLALSQDDSLLQGLKNQGFTGEFVYYNGFDGPIKIWNTLYPSNILSRSEFTQTSGAYGAFDNLTVTS